MTNHKDGHAKPVELAPDLKKFIRKFTIDPLEQTSLAGNKAKLIIEDRVGAKGGTLTVADIIKAVGYMDLFNSECRDLEAKFGRSDRDTLKLHKDRAWKAYCSKARGLVRRYIDNRNKFYEPQGIEMCATWIPVDKSLSVFYVQAFVDVASGNLAWGESKDYARYLAVIENKTQSAASTHSINRTRMRNYLRMGHATKEVAHFISGILAGAAPPLLGFNEDVK